MLIGFILRICFFFEDWFSTSKKEGSFLSECPCDSSERTHYFFFSTDTLSNNKALYPVKTQKNSSYWLANSCKVLLWQLYKCHLSNLLHAITSKLFSSHVNWLFCFCIFAKIIRRFLTPTERRKLLALWQHNLFVCFLNDSPWLLHCSSVSVSRRRLIQQPETLHFA